MGAGFGVFDFFVVRGFDSLTGGLVLTDGAPEPESTFYPLYNVRQVEVLKGPAASSTAATRWRARCTSCASSPRARFADASLTYG